MKFIQGLFFAVLFATSAYAQESLIGKYSGSRILPETGKNQGIVLTITSVENGVVKATYTPISNRCGGDFPMEGTLQGGKLALKSTGSGGRAGDCVRDLELTVNDNKLAGKNILLSK